MKPGKIFLWFALVVLSLSLFTSGCRMHRRDGASRSSRDGAVDTAELIAPSDATPDPKTGEVKLDSSDPDGRDLPEKEEIRRSYTLAPGADVDIHGINGRVTIDNTDASVAEVLIIRSAKKREDLEFRRVKIEHAPTRLMIRVESDRKSVFSALGSIPEGRQRVILRLPKKINLETNGINGDLTAGEIQGRTEIHGVSGEVKIGRADGSVQVGGVNGNIDVSFAPLDRKKIEFNGVNGNIDLRFEGAVNADVNAWGFNGSFDSQLPGTERDENDVRNISRVKARIGTGGSKIEAHGVNGNLKLMKAEKPGTTTAKAPTK
jgi:hypothetical protein